MRTFYVPDMNCKNCAKRITEALNKAGFSGFEVDLANKKVTAEVSDDDAKKIVALISDVGYSPAEATI